MKTFRLWLSICIVTMLSVATGFWVGIRMGADIGFVIDSVPRAAISLHHLHGIAAGKTDNTVIGLESDIDNALLWQHQLEQSGMYPLLEPVWGFHVGERLKYLNRLADYRKDHPSPLQPELLGRPRSESERDREFHKWLIEEASENHRIISQVVERYATKAQQ